MAWFEFMSWPTWSGKGHWRFGYYCGIFECVVIAYLRNVRVKVLFGTEQVDIYIRSL